MKPLTDDSKKEKKEDGLARDHGTQGLTPQEVSYFLFGLTSNMSCPQLWRGPQPENNNEHKQKSTKKSLFSLDKGPGKGQHSKTETFRHTYSRQTTTKKLAPLLLLTRHCFPTLSCINEAAPPPPPPGCSFGECGWSPVFHFYPGIIRWSSNSSPTRE